MKITFPKKDYKDGTLVNIETIDTTNKIKVKSTPLDDLLAKLYDIDIQ